MKLPENLDWNLLRSFNSCSKNKSFAEASRQAGFQASAITVQMKRLEKSLKVELFRRVKGVMINALTPEGYELLAIAQRAENAIHNTSYTDQKQKEIKIYTTNGIASTILSKITTPFLQNFPDINLYVSTLDTPAFLTQHDIVIKVDYQDKENIQKVKLADIELAFYASAEYIKQYGEPDLNKNISNHKFAFLIGGGDMKRLGLETVEPNKKILSSNIDFSYQMCLNGQCITELSSSYPGVEKLIKVFKNKPSMKQTISMFYLEKHKENSPVYLFVKNAITYLSN